MTSEVRAIQTFVHEAQASIKTRPVPRPAEYLDAADAAELRQIGAQLLQAVDTLNQTGDARIELKIESKGLGEFLAEQIMPLKQKQFLSEMALGYLAAHLEAFTTDYLIAVLSGNPQTLKSKSTITIEEIADVTDLEGLWQRIAEKDVHALGYGGIDDIQTYFDKRFNIRLDTFHAWQNLRELMCRRNLIIHNQSRVDQIYRQKVQYKGSATRLITTAEYVSEAADIIIEYFSFVHSAIKFKLNLR